MTTRQHELAELRQQAGAADRYKIEIRGGARALIGQRDDGGDAR